MAGGEDPQFNRAEKYGLLMIVCNFPRAYLSVIYGPGLLRFRRAALGWPH
jgi:hypothetical protein